MPVVGEVDQVVISVHRAATRHMPWRLNGCFAQEGAAELDVLPAASIDVVLSAMEARVVNEHPVNSIYEAMEVANLCSS